MPGAVAGDVLDRVLHRVHDRHGERHRQVLGVPILIDREARRRRGIARKLECPVVEAQLDTRAAQRRQRARQERTRGARVDQQRLGRVAHAGALRLGVHDDRQARRQCRRASTNTWQLPEAA